MAQRAWHRASGAVKSRLKHSPGASETKAEDLPQKVSEKAPAAVNNYKVNRMGHMLTCWEEAYRQRSFKGRQRWLRTCTARKLISHNMLLQSKWFDLFKEPICARPPGSTYPVTPRLLWNDVFSDIIFYSHKILLLLSWLLTAPPGSADVWNVLELIPILSETYQHCREGFWR